VFTISSVEASINRWSNAFKRILILWFITTPQGWI
jgi:hypothetical protein